MSQVLESIVKNGEMSPYCCVGVKIERCSDLPGDRGDGYILTVKLVVFVSKVMHLSVLDLQTPGHGRFTILPSNKSIMSRAAAGSASSFESLFPFSGSFCLVKTTLRAV